MNHRLLPKPTRRQWIFILLIFVAIYVLLPQSGLLKQSIQALKDADKNLFAVAVVFTALTYPVAALTYWLLARKKLRYGRTVVVQIASMFVNRLLPAGIGGMGANYAYLRKARHTQEQAVSVVAANNILGLLGHIILVAVLLALYFDQASGLHLSTPKFDVRRLAIAIIAALLIGALLLYYYRKQIVKHLKAILSSLLTYRQHPARLSAALLSSIALTVCNIVSLYFCVIALHIPLGFVAVMLIFTLGVALGTSTPTPGGLGGVEAGLLAGMVAFGVPASQALAAVLAYRLISYWLALAIGSFAFIFASRRGYF